MNHSFKLLIFTSFCKIVLPQNDYPDNCLSPNICEPGECCALGTTCNTCPYGFVASSFWCSGRGDRQCRYAPPSFAPTTPITTPSTTLTTSGQNIGTNDEYACEEKSFSFVMPASFCSENQQLGELCWSNPESYCYDVGYDFALACGACTKNVDTTGFTWEFRYNGQCADGTHLSAEQCSIASLGYGFFTQSDVFYPTGCYQEIIPPYSVGGNYFYNYNFQSDTICNGFACLCLTNSVSTLSPSDAYTHHPNTNCYNGNGADNLSEQLDGKTLEEVKQICIEMASCDGFGFQTQHQNYEVDIGRYWLRSNIQISDCVENADLDMYVKSIESFFQRFEGVTAEQLSVYETEVRDAFLRAFTEVSGLAAPGYFQMSVSMEGMNHANSILTFTLSQHDAFFVDDDFWNAFDEELALVQGLNDLIGLSNAVIFESSGSYRMTEATVNYLRNSLADASGELSNIITILNEHPLNITFQLHSASAIRTRNQADFQDHLNRALVQNDFSKAYSFGAMGLKGFSESWLPPDLQSLIYFEDFVKDAAAYALNSSVDDVFLELWMTMDELLRLAIFYDNGEHWYNQDTIVFQYIHIEAIVAAAADRSSSARFSERINSHKYLWYDTTCTCEQYENVTRSLDEYDFFCIDEKKNCYPEKLGTSCNSDFEMCFQNGLLYRDAVTSCPDYYYDIPNDQATCSFAQQKLGLSGFQSNEANCTRGISKMCTLNLEPLCADLGGILSVGQSVTYSDIHGGYSGFRRTGSTATISCDRGYSPTVKSDHLTCMGATWVGTFPQCEQTHVISANSSCAVCEQNPCVAQGVAWNFSWDECAWTCDDHEWCTGFSYSESNSESDQSLCSLYIRCKAVITSIDSDFYWKIEFAPEPFEVDVVIYGITYSEWNEVEEQIHETPSVTLVFSRWLETNDGVRARLNSTSPATISSPEAIAESTSIAVIVHEYNIYILESNTYLNLLGASFNELGSKIHLFLDGFTDQAGLDAIFECSELFANWQDFGNFPQCFWVSASRLVISLGHGRTIAVGDSLELTRPIHSQDLTKAAYVGSVVIEGPLHGFFEPQAMITGPEHISHCASAYFSGISSVGSLCKELKYEWSTSNGLTHSGVSFTLPPPIDDSSEDVESNGYVEEITITLNVTNAEGLSSQESRIVYRHATEMPTIEILGGMEQSFTSNNYIELGVEVSMSSCHDEISRDQSFEWTLVGSEGRDCTTHFDIRSTKFIVISPHEVMPNCIYEIEVTVTSDGKQNSATVKLEINAQAPESTGVQTFESDGLFEISIHDLAIFHQHFSHYDIEWGCFFCPERSFVNPTPEILQVPVIVTDMDFVLRVDDFLFPFSVKPMPHRISSSEYVDVTIQTLVYGVMRETERREFIVKGAVNGEPYKGGWEWKVEGLENVTLTTWENYLVIDGRHCQLVPGASFIIQARPEAPYSGFGEIFVDVDVKPNGGTCGSNPTSGAAFEKFELYCMDWSDNDPYSLKYNFMLMDESNSSGIYLSRYTFSNTFLWLNVPPGNHTVRAIVQDSTNQLVFFDFKLYAYNTTQGSESFIETFDDEIDVAIQTGDLSTITTTLLGAAFLGQLNTERALDILTSVRPVLGAARSFLENTIHQAQILELAFAFGGTDNISESLNLVDQFIRDGVNLTDRQLGQQLVDPLLSSLSKLRSITNDTWLIDVTEKMAKTMLIVMYNSINGESFSWSRENQTCVSERVSPTSGGVSTGTFLIPSLNKSTVDIIRIETTNSPLEESGGTTSIEVYESFSGEMYSIRNQDRCRPVQFELPRQRRRRDSIPRCQYFHPSRQMWTEEGCVTLGTNANTTRCACTHLSTFSVAEIEYTPQVNIVTKNEVQQIDLDTVLNHPEPILACVCLILLGLLVTLLAPDTSHIPMIASNMILPQGFSRQVLLDQSDLGKEMKVLRGSYWCKSYQMWCLKLRSEHSVISCCARAQNTNLSTKQRVILFELYAFLILAVSSLFYDPDEQTADTIMIALITLLAMIPVAYFRRVMKKTRPGCFAPQELIVKELTRVSKKSEQDSEKMIYDDSDLEKFTLSPIAPATSVEVEMFDYMSELPAAQISISNGPGILAGCSLRESSRRKDISSPMGVSEEEIAFEKKLDGDFWPSSSKSGKRGIPMIVSEEDVALEKKLDDDFWPSSSKSGRIDIPIVVSEEEVALEKKLDGDFWPSTSKKEEPRKHPSVSKNVGGTSLENAETPGESENEDDDRFLAKGTPGMDFPEGERDDETEKKKRHWTTTTAAGEAGETKPRRNIVKRKRIPGPGRDTRHESDSGETGESSPSRSKKRKRVSGDELFNDLCDTIERIDSTGDDPSKETVGSLYDNFRQLEADNPPLCVQLLRRYSDLDGLLSPVQAARSDPPICPINHGYTMGPRGDGEVLDMYSELLKDEPTVSDLLKYGLAKLDRVPGLSDASTFPDLPDEIISDGDHLHSVIRLEIGEDLRRITISMDDHGDQMKHHLMDLDILHHDWTHGMTSMETFLMLRKHFLIRKTLLEELYPYPSYWKSVLKRLLLILILLCCLFTISFGLTRNRTIKSMDPILAQFPDTCRENKDMRRGLDYQATLDHLGTEPTSNLFGFHDHDSEIELWLLESISALLCAIVFIEPFLLFLKAHFIVNGCCRCRTFKQKDSWHKLAKDSLLDFFGRESIEMGDEGSSP